MSQKRRTSALAALAALGVVALGGCTAAGATPTSWTSTPSKAAASAGPGSTSVVCGKLRTAFTADLKPLGTALGKLVGLRTAGTSDGQADAQEDAVNAIKKLGSDISSASAPATDKSLVSAGRSASQAVDALATPSFLASVTSVDAIATATQKLQQAAAPVTQACAGTS